MSINKELFNKRFLIGPLNWPCPKCTSGTLATREGGKKKLEHKWSAAAHSHDAWEPEWIEGTFVWTLECSDASCGQIVIATGAYTVDWDIEDTPDGPAQVYLDIFEPKAFSEPVPVFRVMGEVPSDIREKSQEAFGLLWFDGASCLNKIRSCLEALLTERKIPRFSASNGKRHKIPLHSRIETYRAKEPEIGNLLMALKWLGNEGSHSSTKSENVERTEILDAFEILEHVLELVYYPRSKSIATKAKRINKKKGL